MASEATKLRILMFPWLAFGHIIPYLELAKLLAQRGNKIYFVSTPRNIERLPKLPPNLVPNIDLIGLPLPKIENLPEDAESTLDLPYHKVRYLKIAYDELQHCHVSHLLQTLSHSLDCAILDFASYCLFPLIEKLNIPTIYFSIFTASTLGFVGPTSGFPDGSNDDRDFTVKPGWVPFDTDVVVPRSFEMERVFKEHFVDGGNVSDMYRLATTVKGTHAVAVRSSYEFEPEWLKVVEDIYQKPIIPVGLLPTTTSNYNEDEKLVVEWREIKEWLDKQEKGSVLYVAFGSETKPNQEEVAEIALGLELSGIPFFWVFRNQRGSADEEMTELPQGFEERIRGRRVIHTSWAPQVKILSHDSVGGVLTHSGWSTVVEAMRFVKPLVLLPFLMDQGIIARQVAGKKLGYEIPRNNDSDGSFDRKSVAESVRMVMVKEEGRIYRDKAKEMKGLLFDEDKQDEYVNKLLDYLHALTSK